MYIPKQYGKSKVEKCPFCEQQATITNKQGLIVCRSHSNAKLGDMKCLCGKYVDLKIGKWGVYFSCLSCGNMNAKKIFEVNNVLDVHGKSESNFEKTKKNTEENKYNEKNNLKRKNPTEITIRSDDPRYFD